MQQACGWLRLNYGKCIDVCVLIIGVFALVLLLVAAVKSIAVAVAGTGEISGHKYQMLVQEMPTMPDEAKALLEAALEDDIVSDKEFNDIYQKIPAMKARRNKTILKEMVNDNE